MTATRLCLVALLLAALSFFGCAEPEFEGDGPDPDYSADAIERGNANTDGFQDLDPDMTAAEYAAIAARYADVPHQGVRQALFERAVAYFDLNKLRIRNKRYLSIVDFRKHSREKRFYVLDMTGGPMKSFVVAHGTGSDPNDDGYASTFSNTPNSRMSSLGYFVTAEQYEGANGLSMRMDGLSETNSKVRERLIVIHKADYVQEGRDKQGLSWGCFAFSFDDIGTILRDLGNGAIIFAAR